MQLHWNFEKNLGLLAYNIFSQFRIFHDNKNGEEN